MNETVDPNLRQGAYRTQMSKRKLGEVLEEREARTQAQLASVVTKDDTKGSASGLSNSDDEEMALQGGSSSSDEGHSSDSGQDEDINKGHEISSREEGHWNSPSMREGWRREEKTDEQKREESSSAFGRAFGKILNKRITGSDLVELSGPVLADRKRLLLEKLDRKDAERTAKVSSKEDTREIREKGHALPFTYTDGKEKALIRLATKGVVRLFNAVSKAQKVQSSADNSSGSAANGVLKQTKATFLTELRRPDLESQLESDNAIKESAQQEPRWPALKPNFMSGRSLKRAADWDKSL